MKRRDFLRYAAAFAGTTVVGGSLWQEALAAYPAMTGAGPYGPLQAPDANGLRLPPGFTSREVARGIQPVAATGYSWHVAPDGGACFPDAGGGWIYVSNSEFFPVAGIPNSGGASAIRFASDASITGAYSILSGSNSILNCAGGCTPWGTWLSCEEIDAGLVWECDPQGVAAAVSHPAMGRFSHEAVAADTDGQRFYLTEDQPDGRFYRFTPNAWGNLSTGLLEVAEVGVGNQVTWHTVPTPNPADPVADPTRLQVPASTAFNGGEGIVYSFGQIYFTTKGDGRVWSYVPATGTLTLVYDDDLDPGGTLSNVDNITGTPSGDLIVAEDKSSQQQLVLIAPGGVVSPLVEMDQAGSEFAGPALNPAGTHLYFSSQRGPGPGGTGITYEVTGPFRRFASTVASCFGT